MAAFTTPQLLPAGPLPAVTSTLLVTAARPSPLRGYPPGALRPVYLRISVLRI